MLPSVPDKLFLEEGFEYEPFENVASPTMPEANDYTPEEAYMTSIWPQKQNKQTWGPYRGQLCNTSETLMEIQLGAATQTRYWIRASIKWSSRMELRQTLSTQQT